MRTGSRTQGSDGWSKAILAGAAIAALGGAANHFFFAPRKHDVSAPARAARIEEAPAPRARPPVVVASARRDTESAAPPAEPPRSLAGTSEDGALRVDEDGNLVIEPAVLRFFDYYLSATGEESAAAIRARVAQAIARRLGNERAAGQAMALFDTYVGYRESTRRLSARDDDLGARLDGLKALRRRAFGAANAEKLFGDEERTVAVSLEQRRVLGDKGLSAADRESRLAALEQRLPEAVRAAREDAIRPLRQREEEEAMRANGASDDDVRAYRVATVGDAAADRLAELDRRRAAWQARLTAFREARAAILRTENDPDRQRAAVQKLLDGSFTPLEQIRVAAADQIDSP
jgi:lipase chaperone LimK